MDNYRHLIEIDAMQLNELDAISKFAAHNKLPAIVVQPILIHEAFAYKYKYQGKYKVFAAVDWPKGENISHTKFRGLSVDAMEADGFEVMLSVHLQPSGVIEEMHALMDLAYSYMGGIADFRFVLGTIHRSIDDVLKICEGVTRLSPKPSMLRTDVHTKPQVNKANPELHSNLIRLANEIVPFNFKVSGNISSSKSITATAGASVFAVNFSQAKNILSDTPRNDSTNTKVFA